MTRTLKPLFTWRSAIAESDLPAPARLVALTLSLHMSERGDSAFPSLETLARESGLAKGTVARHMGILDRRGYLNRIPGGGQGHPTRYTATIPKPSQAETVSQEDSPTGVDELSPWSTPNGLAVRQEDVRLGRKTEDVLHSAFAEFWSTYPRKQGKGEALKAFKNATKRADVARILAGASSFAADPNLPDGKFIPHPSTWLNQDRWEDDPLPERNGQSGAARSLALADELRRRGM